MTTLATAGRTREGRGADHRPPSRRRGRWAALCVLLLVAGAAIGRFLLAAPPAEQAPELESSIAATIREYEDAVAARPDDLTSWQVLGLSYTRRAVEVGDPALYDLAGRAFDEADGLSPDHPETLLGRGNLALSLHAFADALEFGQRALDAQPDDAAALGVIVDAEVELGRYDAAAEHLQQMLDRRPDLAALSRTSYLRELHGDLDGAIEAMRQAEAAGSGSPFDLATVVALLGDLRLKRGELAAADQSYLRAERLASGHLGATMGRARLLAARDDVDAAIAVLAPAVDRYPQPAAVILLGELQALAGQDVEAADTFELVGAISALQEQSGQVTDLEMALFEADHGDPVRAVERAGAAYEARPDNIFAADARGWALFRAGRVAEALPFAEQAVRLGTADGLVRYHAAAIFAAAGETQRAGSELQAAFALAPWTSLAHGSDAAALAGRLGVEVPEVPEVLR